MSTPFQLGGLREQLLSTDPTELVKELTDKDYHRRNFPRESQDKSPTTAPLGLVSKALARGHQLELFMCSADFPVDTNTLTQQKSRGALPAGAKHTIRCSYQPDFWQIYTFKAAGATVGDLLYFSVLTDVPSLPADVLVVTADISTVATIPGRGDTIGIWTPATNAGSVSAVLRAVRGLRGGDVGVISVE